MSNLPIRTDSTLPEAFIEAEVIEQVIDLNGIKVPTDGSTIEVRLSDMYRWEGRVWRSYQEKLLAPCIEAELQSKFGIQFWRDMFGNGLFRYVGGGLEPLEKIAVYDARGVGESKHVEPE